MLLCSVTPLLSVRYGGTRYDVQKSWKGAINRNRVTLVQIAQYVEIQTHRQKRKYVCTHILHSPHKLLFIFSTDHSVGSCPIVLISNIRNVGEDNRKCDWEQARYREHSKIPPDGYKNMEYFQNFIVENSFFKNYKGKGPLTKGWVSREGWGYKYRRLSPAAKISCPKHPREHPPGVRRERRGSPGGKDGCKMI